MLTPRIVNPDVTAYILKRHGLHFRKGLGQNFLIDARVLEQIITAARLSPDETVVEIGPGIGTLTQALAENVRKVFAVELDAKLVAVLAQTLEDYDNVEVIQGDILKVALDFAPRFKVVANLPYYITTPIIMRLLEEHRKQITGMVVMVQKEVAERMVAVPGGKDYGVLSVAVQYYTRPRLEAVVPKNAFMPQPQVDSAVVSLAMRQQPAVQVRDEAFFFKVVKAGFGQRRKTLLNALNAAFAFSKEEIRERVAPTGIDLNRRGETLSLQEFAVLAEALFSPE